MGDVGKYGNLLRQGVGHAQFAIPSDVPLGVQ